MVSPSLVRLPRNVHFLQILFVEYYFHATLYCSEYKDNKLIYHWGCPGTQGYVSFSRRPEYLLFLNEDDTVDMLDIHGNKLANFEKSIKYLAFPKIGLVYFI